MIFMGFTINELSIKCAILFFTEKMSKSLCLKIQHLTREQSDSPLWHEMRYARITASNIYQASKCQTNDGAFVKVSSIFRVLIYLSLNIYFLLSLEYTRRISI